MVDKEKARARQQDRYYGFKEMGLCTRCGKDYAMIDRTVCPECSFKEAEKARERLKNQTEEHRLKRLEYIKGRKQKNVELGLCPCGKERNDKRYKLCAECRLYYRKKQQEYAQPKNYEKICLCRWCGEETAEGTKYCAKHLEQMRQLCERNFRPNGVNIGNSEYFRGLNNAFWEERKTNQIQGEEG